MLYTSISSEWRLKVSADISLEDRLAHGNVTIAELSELSGRCKASIYNDIKARLLPVIKLGKAKTASVRIAGPIAKRYIAGELHAEGGNA